MERDWSKTKVWFPRQPVGVNTINQFMKNMTKEGGLDITANNFTNHSVRNTAVRKLKKGGASSREIMGKRHRGWGGGNRGRLPRAPSVRGPPNSAGLASLRGCFTVFSTEVKQFFCFACYAADEVTWLLRSPVTRAPNSSRRTSYVLFDPKPLIEDSNLQVYMYCVHARKQLQEPSEHTSEHVKSH